MADRIAQILQEHEAKKKAASTGILTRWKGAVVEHRKTIIGTGLAVCVGVGLLVGAAKLMFRSGRQITEQELLSEPQTKDTGPVIEVVTPSLEPPGEVVMPVPPSPVAGRNDGETQNTVQTPAAPARPAAPAVKPASPQPVKKDPVKPPKRGRSGIIVQDSKLCLGVKDRQPQSVASKFSVASGKVYCWVRVANGQGKKVKTVWYLGGKKYDGTWLAVGSASWRTWAYKNLDASMKGEGRVEIVDESGNVLKELALLVN
jgi:hypothetical protein